MKKILFASHLVLALGMGALLTGCEQTLKIKDGLVPDEFLPHVQNFLGGYHGQIDRRAIQLTASLEGNRLVLKASEDLIDSACQSSIGNLAEVSYHEEKDKTVRISQAYFEFNPNLCANDVAGKDLKLTMIEQSPILFDLSYLDHFEYRWNCNGTYYPGPGPGPSPGYPGNHCWQERIGVYNSGRFARD